MLRCLYNALTIVALLYIALMVVLAVPSFFDPQFEIRNESAEPVSVIAEWRDQEKAFPDIAAASTVEFSVEDEAGMVFRVRYADGRQVESEPIYFSRGLTVIATITEEGVEVRYDHDI
ncbi:hypothetical protein SR882_04595 [Guyparkeria halophila]|uniref:Uncharacterized protein n=1 Tax=Guyparkeria halophila TaxID=47960 RepID=A0ABZ0YYC7_9GAMM|nr:hypothetical protein [Guyparkeria halophila]WQH17188.1 hypothetical protein SR882_04595 [Guyparkeria halophila]